MDAKNLSGMKVAALVTEGFEQVELTGPRDALQAEGAQVVIVSHQAGEVQAFKHHDRADKFKVELSFDHARAADFDAVLLPGGVVNGDQIRLVKPAQKFVQDMDEAGKPIFVICHGGWLLISAGLVHGRSMTSWPTLQDDIKNAGGQWVDRAAVVDGKWVSSRKPADLPDFNRAIIDMLHMSGEAARSGKLGSQMSLGMYPNG
jgi:protease I